MKRKNTFKKLILAAIITLAATVVPVKLNQTVKAESNQAVTKGMIEAKIEETQRTKRFGNYNEAYAMIIQLPQSEQTKYLDELGKLADYVYTLLNKEMINSLREFAENANLRDYEAMIVLINDKIKDPIDNGYFLGELTSWGKKLVYTPDVVTAVDAVIKVYSQKTVQSVDTAKAAITKVKNIDSREYLKEQLIEAAGKVDSVILVYFD
jgi:urease gamma subunit